MVEMVEKKGKKKKLRDSGLIQHLMVSHLCHQTGSNEQQVSNVSFHRIVKS